MSATRRDDTSVETSHRIEAFCLSVKKDIAENVAPRPGLFTDFLCGIEALHNEETKSVRTNALNMAAFEITDCINMHMRHRLKGYLAAGLGEAVPDAAACERLYASMAFDRRWFEAVVSEAASYRSEKEGSAIASQIIDEAGRALAHYVMMMDTSVELMQSRRR